MLNCKVCFSPLSIDNTLKIENVPSTTFKFSGKTIDLKVVSCEHCGCVQLYDNKLSDDYMAVYRSMGVSPSYLADKSNKLKAIVEKYDLQEPVLEIGCGDGQLLEIIHGLGLSCRGVEYDKRNAIKARRKGFIVYNDISTNYDTFFMFYFLEHIPSPNEFMSKVYNHLNYNGFGVIEVPNYDYIEKNNIWLEFTIDHVIYYRERTLTYLLSSCGFNIESICGDGLCLTAIVSKKYEDSTFSNMRNSIDFDLTEFKTLADRLGEFCVYGAGHYSQIILNELFSKYGIRPKHIYDSNKDKCGDSICGVEILHGGNIKRDCDAIIVICGMYNDEVYDVLSSKQLFKEVIKWN